MPLSSFSINKEDLKIEIQYVNHSLGNRFDNLIELNENLLKYPKLHDSVLSHEISHTDNSFSIKDLKIDLSKSANSWDMLKFMIRYPKSFYQLLPFYYSRKHGFVYDINLILIYFVTICFFSLVYFLAVSV